MVGCIVVAARTVVTAMVGWSEILNFIFFHLFSSILVT